MLVKEGEKLAILDSTDDEQSGVTSRTHLYQFTLFNVQNPDQVSNIANVYRSSMDEFQKLKLWVQ